MTLQDAMTQRHTVRRFTSAKLPADTVRKLRERTQVNNETYGLSIQLVTNHTDALNLFAKLFMSTNVRNYWILAAPDSADCEEKLGYCGADLMLYAQTLGLNTWWVGGTYNHKMQSFVMQGSKVMGILAVGYGKNAGKPHTSKQLASVSSYDGTMPEWFRSGVNAALLAPTALGKQDFFLKGSGAAADLQCDGSSYSNVERGILKYHFELGAGKENFEWQR